MTVRGRDISVDMTGVTLEGGPPFADPDRYAGTGVQIEGAGVTISGATIRGYKIAVLARRSPRLPAIRCRRCSTRRRSAGAAIRSTSAVRASRSRRAWPTA